MQKTITSFMRRAPLITLLLACATWSAPAGAFDLLEAANLALVNEPGYKAASDTLRAGLEKLPQGRAGLLPSVSLQANTAMNHGAVSSTDFPAQDRDFNSNGYTVSLTQPLLRMQNYQQYRQAAPQVEQSYAQLDAARGDLLGRVAEKYFTLLLAEENVQLAGAQKRSLAEQQELAKRNFEAGLATITDAKEAQAKYDLVVAQELEARDEREVALRSIEQLTGVYPQSFRQLRASFSPLPFSPADLDYWLRMADSGNPQIRGLTAALEVAEREVEKQRAAHMPTLDFVASRSVNNSGGQMTFSSFPLNASQHSYALQLNIPLYAGGGIDSHVREALAMRDRSRNELDAARLDNAVKVRQAYLGVVSGVERIRALETSIESNKIAVESSRIGLKVGTRTNADVLNAQQQLYTARRDYAQAKSVYFINRVRLAAATGTLDPDLLASINAYLEDR